MKRVVSQVSGAAPNSSAMNSIPDISNRPLTIDQVVSWLDKLIEAKNHDENTSNNRVLQ